MQINFSAFAEKHHFFRYQSPILKVFCNVLTSRHRKSYVELRIPRWFLFIILQQSVQCDTDPEHFRDIVDKVLGIKVRVYRYCGSEEI